MSYKSDFNVFVGGKSGVFKGVKLEAKACIMKNIQSLVSIKDHDGVTALSWGNTNEKEILIASGLKDVRSVKVYDTECSTFTCSFFCDVGEGTINGISRYDDAILTAVQSGEVKLWRFSEDDQPLLNAGPDLRRMRHSHINKNVIATGGKENKLKLFDLERRSQIFIEKNVPHDWLELKVPIWISDITFLPNCNQTVTVGRYGHIRLYDPQAQRRPVINLEMKDEALTSLAVMPREKQIVVGSGKGRMNLIDLRKPGKILNTYKGFVGGVTGVACSPSQPYIVSVGIDRYLRVHHVDTKALVKKVYLTSKLTCMLLRSDFTLETEDGDQGLHKSDVVCSQNEDAEETQNGIKRPQDDSGSEAEYDALFEKMTVITNKEDLKRKWGNQSITSDKEIDQRDVQKRKKSSKNLKSDRTPRKQSI